MQGQLNLEGKVALITGAARGIGKHIATRFVEHGARVVISDVRDELGEQTSAELGAAAEFVHCDISALDDVKSMVDGTVKRAGHIDILVNNAAYNPASPEERTTVDDYSDEVFVKMIDVDINGTYYCSKYTARQMITQKSGVIINIASIAGVVPIRNQIGHVVGKAGVIRMAEAMALELGGHGIRVNSISPGSTVTDATRGLFYNEAGDFNEQGKKLLSFVPAGRPAQTEDVANAALFLASDMASYITGQNLVVDGGWTCGFTRDF
jgi:3-oxoacyl-[acyl-carrier protein] reductase